MEDDLERRASEVLAFYDEEARASLEELLDERIKEIDLAAQSLRESLSTRPLIRVGFLGESQVGKSSIINALIGQRVLPSGGVGPLTAQKTALTHASSASFRVRYHGRQRLNAFRFALERYFEWLREIEAATEAADEPSFETHVFDTNPEEDKDARLERNRVGGYLVAQARLMLGLTHDTEVSNTELLSLVRALAAKDESAIEWPTNPELRERIANIRRLCDTTEEIDEGGDVARFHDELELRAAGWMSPLIAELRVSLDAPILKKIELLDLPGVGVVGDPAARVAEEFIAKEADAVVIVMRNSGLTEQVADLLEKTGIISRLLWSAESQRQSVSVIVAVTHLDDVAKDTWRRRALEARRMGKLPPDRGEVFRELAEPMVANVKRQLTQALMDSGELEDLTPEQREKREKVIRALAERMTVHCVAAPDYLAIREGFADDSFLRTEEATNIPRLANVLVGLSQPLMDERRQRLQESRAAFVSLLSAILTQEEFRHRFRQHRASDAENFRKACELVAEPLKIEAERVRQAFHGVLDDGLRNASTFVANEAAEHANKRLSRLKTSGARLSWQTLNAALVRGGSFRGKRNTVDYPGSLTRAFVDVIASNWEPRIVKRAQKAHDDLGEAEAKLVEMLVERASELAGSEDEAAALRGLREQVRRKGRATSAWTQTELQKLTEAVRVELLATVAPIFEKACLEARRAGANRGRGASARMLAVLDVAGRKAIDEAGQRVTTVIDEHLARFRRRFVSMVDEQSDPVSQALEAIVSTHGEAVARFGEERRKMRLGAVRALYEKLRAIDSQSSARTETVTKKQLLASPRSEATASKEVTEAGAVDGGMNQRAVGDIFDDL